MDTQEQINDFLEGQFLKSDLVQEGDIVYVKEIVGLVDASFGKQKFRLILNWRNKPKILDANASQYKQLMGNNVVGQNFKIHKTPFGKGYQLSFESA